MAVKSGMVYDKIIQLCETLTTKANTIAEIFDEMKTQRVAEISTYYSGEAAESFKESLTTISAKVQADLDSIIKNIKDEAETQKTDYTSQDDKLTGTL